ncbi:MAG: ABC transporter substrate-binding protein [Hungatella sp.]|nr:ABC transporter substrate-binding protein [Hungatella sp.]
MKKVLSMVMACAITAAALTGCSSAASESKTTETVTTAETTAETVKAESAEAETTKAVETEAAKETAAETSKAAESDVTLRVGSMKGPTTMGLVSLMDKHDKGEAKGAYEFTMVTAADELMGKVVSGDVDIALVPANLASILYQKTKQNIQVLNINTLGVLYVVAADDSIQSIPDLKGKTVYMTGKGTTPDYAFHYLLAQNGMGDGDVTIEYKSEAAEVAAVLKEQPDAIGLLPQPFVTVAMAQNENLKMVLDLTKEWDGLEGSSGSLVTGVTVCRKDVLEDPHKAEAVKVFMEEHGESADFANANPEETAGLVAAAGIIEKAPIAQKALPYCSIVCIGGDEMKELLSGYLQVLCDQDPSSIGGQLPDDGFYYSVQ